ncbi:2-amino-4-hydroxy-6-hydroxymethyldihydropteridine diphosphokinase [Flammeovirga sp. EKP202]|uniref:2-amino-4-hydroxy-6- hydroxymethyldihydropteridine diphosphokinase n=1 Tax=Flammeovirga sp. EKP202 TaxID=2770592 RepID=UPI00165FA55A|nr:2-amino-4-hydroxy-6-hydroxymethyldihydropteridine diphosphokinase [Flammeovirga sp. EKP202]MBD0402113.1 2-amino-4-hydroxy-6-hydroxymethyldihydropteridine diphosphokinase [Flammeovirga sp. EKP202]
MSEKNIVLLLGANLGNKEETLRQAVMEINNDIGEVLSLSHFYETAAWGKEDQPSYYNQVLVCKTTMSPQDLLNTTQNIEHKLGRVRKEKWGARIIDVDILFIESEVVSDENLKVPHPFIQERRFTLEPLTEILPNFVHPVLNQSLSDILLRCKDPLTVKKLLIK